MKDKREKEERRIEIAKRIRVRLADWELPVTHENIRRWFDMFYGRLPNEKVIQAIFRILTEGRDKN